MRIWIFSSSVSRIYSSCQEAGEHGSCAFMLTTWSWAVPGALTAAALPHASWSFLPTDAACCMTLSYAGHSVCVLLPHLILTLWKQYLMIEQMRSFRSWQKTFCSEAAPHALLCRTLCVCVKSTEYRGDAAQHTDTHTLRQTDTHAHKRSEMDIFLRNCII